MVSLENINLAVEIEKYIIPDNKFQDSGLMTGYAGICLFYHKLYEVTGVKEYEKKYEYCLNKVYNSIGNDILSFDIKSGLSGIVWLLKYLDKKGCTETDPDFYNEITVLLNRSFINELTKDNWEYMRGALGCLHIIDEEKLYVELFNYLEQSYENNHGELYNKFYNKNTNLGLPFGISSILYFLNKSSKYNRIRDKSQKIRSIVLSILQKNQQTENNAVFYPSASDSSEKCRLAWCYGELTIASQLLINSEYFNDEELKSKAIKIAKDSTLRTSLEDTMIMDACLQHGAAGNYLLYKLFYKKTNDRLFEEASLYWKKRTMDFLNERNYLFLDRYKLNLYHNNSLLEGLAGVGLALLLDSDDEILSAILL